VSIAHSVTLVQYQELSVIAGAGGAVGLIIVSFVMVRAPKRQDTVSADAIISDLVVIAAIGETRVGESRGHSEIPECQIIIEHA
jgi:hypothetical protein